VEVLCYKRAGVEQLIAAEDLRPSRNTSSAGTNERLSWCCAEIAANAALTLISVANALLDRQIASQAAAFEAEGGFTERLYRMRSRKRHAP
jgi:four helix bundle suffix protein